MALKLTRQRPNWLQTVCQQKRQLWLEKITFWAKELEKNGFFGLSDVTSLKPVAILLYCFNCIQTCRIAADLNVKDVQITKTATLIEKKQRFEPKNVSKRIHWGFQVWTKTLRNSPVRPRWCANSKDSRPLGCTRRCNNKKGKYREKKVFWAKNFENLVF